MSEAAETKIHILDVTLKHPQKKLEKIKLRIAEVRQIAQKHGVRSLLIMPFFPITNDDHRRYDVSFQIRMHNDTYYLSEFRAFTGEVGQLFRFRILPEIYSPNNPSILFKAHLFKEPFTNKLDESEIGW